MSAELNSLILILKYGGQAHVVHPLEHAVFCFRSKEVGSHAGVLRFECIFSVDSIIFGKWTYCVGGK